MHPYGCRDVGWPGFGLYLHDPCNRKCRSGPFWFPRGDQPTIRKIQHRIVEGECSHVAPQTAHIPARAGRAHLTCFTHYIVCHLFGVIYFCLTLLLLLYEKKKKKKKNSARMRSEGYSCVCVSVCPLHFGHYE